MADKNYYDILGVSKTASADEIKSAYRKLAKKYHPDINTGPEAATKFKEINEAYVVLGDSKKRGNYDQFGSAEGANFGDFFGGNGNFGGFGGFTDIFGDIFSAFGGGRAQRVEKGDDISTSITLSFEEAAFGVVKEINIQKVENCSKCMGTGAKDGKEYTVCQECSGRGTRRYTQQTLFGTTITEGPCKNCNATGKIIKEKCSDCSGRGYKKVNKIITVNIPAGIDDGQTINMRGEGNAPVRNGINGDLRINVRVQPHKVLVRKDYDLYLDLYVPFTVLLLGGDVEIPTLKGNQTINIKELTQSETKITLKGKGLKVLNRESYGNCIITLKSEVPKHLDKKIKEALKAIDSQLSDGSYPKYKSYLDKIK